MPNANGHRGFFKQFDKQVNKLITPITILPVMSRYERFKNVPVTLKALWDTGATVTCMQPEIRDRLGLRMFRQGSSVTIAGVGGTVKADFTIVDMLLTDNLEITDCPVFVLDFPKTFDVIIGMKRYCWRNTVGWTSSLTRLK